MQAFLYFLPPYGSCTGERVMYVSAVVLVCNAYSVCSTFPTGVSYLEWEDFLEQSADTCEADNMQSTLL